MPYEFEQWWRETGCLYDPASISEFSTWTPLTELAFKAGYDRGVKSVTKARLYEGETARYLDVVTALESLELPSGVRFQYFGGTIAMSTMSLGVYFVNLLRAPAEVKNYDLRSSQVSAGSTVYFDVISEDLVVISDRIRKSAEGLSLVRLT